MADRMGTTKSVISGLEAAGRHAPSLATLKRYAAAVGHQQSLANGCYQEGDRDSDSRIKKVPVMAWMQREPTFNSSVQ